MSSTTIIACISCAIRWHAGEDCEPLNRNLSLLKIFVLCSKKLKGDASLKQFLVRIEEKLWQNTVNLHGCSNFSDTSPVAETFEQFIYSLQEEMEDRYGTMLACTCTPHSTPLMTNEILEIITSILEITTLDFAEIMYPLRIQMRFLKSFLQFVTKGNTEARKDLLAHSETIAINTAYVLFHCLYLTSGGWSSHSSENNPSEDWEERVSSGVSTWVQKIKSIDPQVYEIYTHSLSSSKLAKQRFGDDALLVVKNFLDSLISVLADIILADILSLDTRCIGLMKDQLQELYGRLVSLKIILKQQLIGNFDMNIQREIADVVTDAGISICSFYQPKMYVSSGHQHLLDRFEIVLSKIAEADPQIPIFNSPRTSSYGFVDCILEKLMELTRSEAESTNKSHVETIQVELACVRCTLREMGLYDENVEVQTLWDRLLEVAFKLESVFDYQAIDPLSNSFSTSFDPIIHEISNIKADVLKVKVKENRSRTYNHLPSQITPSKPNEVIGLHDEEREVLDRLRGGTQHLRLIAIVGMPGVGKTTLASKVYNHSSLSYHFLAKAWCPIPQILDKKKILTELLKQIGHAMSSETSSEHELADQLRRSLKGKRFLIFLDDIWNTEVWKNLKGSFPDDNKGSRIIFTSRSLDIAPSEMLDQEPIILRPLSDNNSLKLLGSKLFPGQGYCFPPGLHDLGMQIVARCGGLPLAIIIVAGVLSNAEAGAWEGIMGSFNFFSSEGNFRYTMEFSYRHLPYYLRPCFLYFGAFSEDQEVSVTRLLRLWIAEGFVRKSETSSLEDVAEGYLNMLIGRSLITGAKRKSDGRVKACHIHDLLREFCLEKAKDEHFFHFVKGSDEIYSFKEAVNPRRLLIDCEPETLRESKMYCPQARSLLLRGSGKFYEGMSSALRFFKLLKVLDLEQIDVGHVFPTAIEQLILLAFLALRGGGLTIPSWLSKLSYLETLILRMRASELSLPDNLWNMQRLKYLCLRGSYGMVGVLPMKNLDDSSILYELDRFKGAIIDWRNMEKQLRKFPNIRKLKCLIYQNTSFKPDFVWLKFLHKCVFPDFLSKLESLDMSGRLQPDFGVRFGFASLTNLKRLKLSELYLHWEIFSVIGNQLPSLEVLKLWGLKFKGEEEYTWEMKKGEFSKLRILHVGGIPLRRWIACDDHEFDCFQKLVLEFSSTLVELPSCLETIETLEGIEVSFCTKAVEDLVTRIEESQNNWGNSGLKITRR